MFVGAALHFKKDRKNFFKSCDEMAALGGKKPEGATAFMFGHDVSFKYEELLEDQIPYVVKMDCFGGIPLDFSETVNLAIKLGGEIGYLVLKSAPVVYSIKNGSVVLGATTPAIPVIILEHSIIVEKRHLPETEMGSAEELRIGQRVSSKAFELFL